MTKKKKIILICAIAACAVALIVGITVGCVSCSSKGPKHNWEWDWDSERHWQYCTDDDCDEETEKVPHTDADGDDKCDECKASLKKEEPPVPQPPVEETETATIHFHKPEEFGDKVYAHAYYHDSESDSDKNLTGDWKSYEVTTTEDGWYTIEIKHPKGLLEEGSFNLMIVPEEGSSINVTIDAAEMWVNVNGNLFATKAEALADEEVERVEYAIYYYAPDWAEGEKVYIYTYNGPSVGEYNTEMLADGEDGWYKITFKTTLELTEFHVMFHTSDDETVKRDLLVTVTDALLDGKAFYFIDNGDGVYANKADAEEAYANPVKEPEYSATATIYFHKPADFGDKVYAHAYYNNGTSNKDLTGAWMTYEVTNIEDGWYIITVKHPENLFETSSFTLMIIRETEASIDVTITAAEMWVNANGNPFTTKEAAEADEEAEAVEYAIYYYAPNWPKNESVYGYTYGGPSVGEYNTEMTADGTDGWYKITFETTLELTEFHAMFHTLDDETVKRDLLVTVTEELLEGKAFYFIDNGNGVYSNKAEAVAAYEENEQQGGNPVEKQTVTIYYHSTGEISVHAYYYTSATTTVDITNYNTRPSMTADTNNSGWLKVDLEIPANIFDDYTNFTAMIVGAAGGDKYVQISATETWISAKGNVFATKALAEADDHVHSYGNTYVYERDGVADPTYHWQVCESCGEESDPTLHEYETDGTICTICGYEKTVIVGHIHEWSDEYDTSVAGYHTQACTDPTCNETNTQPHEFESLSHICTVCEHNEDAGKVRIYVNVNTLGFTSDEYYIYAWGDTEVFGGWPGVKLDYNEGNGWYSVAVATTSPTDFNDRHPIIHNNDEENDQRWEPAVFSGISNDVTEYFMDRESNSSTTNPYNLEEVTFRIKIDKSQLSSGSTYYIYAHEDGHSVVFGEWNDTVLTKENPDDSDDNWYTITINISKTYSGTCNIMIHTEIEGAQYDAMSITATNGNWNTNGSTDIEVIKANA